MLLSMFLFLLYCDKEARYTNRIVIIMMPISNIRAYSESALVHGKCPSIFFHLRTLKGCKKIFFLGICRGPYVACPYATTDGLGSISRLSLSPAN